MTAIQLLQDSFAIQSYERGIAAQNSGSFAWEIATVSILFCIELKKRFKFVYSQ